MNISRMQERERGRDQGQSHSRSDAAVIKPRDVVFFSSVFILLLCRLLRLLNVHLTVNLCCCVVRGAIYIIHSRAFPAFPIHFTLRSLIARSESRSYLSPIVSS